MGPDLQETADLVTFTEEILKAIVNLFSYGEKRILLLYENNHYITPYKINCFFLNI